MSCIVPFGAFLFKSSQINFKSPALTRQVSSSAPGVSAASLVALKSQFAKKQEEISGTGVRHAVPTNVKARHHGGGGGSVSALLQRSNPGVSERDRVDRLAVKVKKRP